MGKLARVEWSSPSSLLRLTSQSSPQGSRKRKEPNKELVKAVNSAVLETVSVLVDDGLLEKVSVKQDQFVGESCDDVSSKFPSEDVFKHVLTLLCHKVPHFGSLLLVRLIEVLANVYGENCRIVDYDNLLEDSENSPFIGTTKFSRKEYLVSWIKWLLTPKAGKTKQGKEVFFLEGYEPNESVMGMDSYFIDLPQKMVKELLYICLRSCFDKQTRFEVINLLVGKIQSRKFSRKVIALASLSSPGMQDEICGKVDQCGLKIDEEDIERSLSKNEAALMECKKRLKLLFSEHDKQASKDCPSEAPHHGSFPRNMVSDNSYGDADCQNDTRSQLHGSWALTKEWAPCAIGTIPSAICCSRQALSFDLVGMNPQLGTSAGSKAANVIEEQYSVQPDSYTAKNTPVASMLGMKSKNVIGGSYTDEAVPTKKLKPEPDSYKAKNAPVANILDMKSKNVIGGSHTDEAAPIKKFEHEPDSYTTKNAPVANILDMKHKNVIGGSHTDEAAQANKIEHEPDKVTSDFSPPERNLKLGPSERASPFQGVLLIDGVYQTCNSAQLSAIQSAIHIM